MADGTIRRAWRDFFGDRDTAYLTLLALAAWLPFYLSTAVLLAQAVYVLASRERRQALRAKRFPGLLVWLLPLVALVGSALGRNPVGAAITLLMAAILTAGFYGRTLMTPERFERGLGLLCLCSLPAAALATVQNFVIYGFNPDYRPTATTFNANCYGMLIVFAILTAVYKLLRGERRGFYGAVAAVNVYALFISESRSSLLGLLCAGVLYLVLRRKYWIAGACAAGGTALVAAGWFRPELFSWTNSLLYIITERAQIWRDAWTAITETPLALLLGRGPMAYRMVWERLGLYEAYLAHNILLESLMDCGIAGTAVFLSFLGTLAAAACFRNRTGQARDARILFGVVLAEVLAAGMVDTTIFWMQTAAFFLFLYGGTALPSPSPATSPNTSKERFI